MATSLDGICFVICPIGDEGTEVRKRADQVFAHVISPAVMQGDYTPVRADRISKPGVIGHDIVRYLAEAPLVVADLTGANANVFYELALRHALRKPAIHLIQHDERPPFDVFGQRTILLDHHDLDSVDAAKKRIAEQVRHLESAPDDFDNPISLALNVLEGLKSSNPVAQALAEITRMLSEMAARMPAPETSNAEDASLKKLDAILDRARDSFWESMPAGHDRKRSGRS